MSRGKVSAQGLTKKRHDLRLPNGRLLEKPLQRKAKWGEKAGTSLCTMYPQASYFEKARNVCQKFLVRMYNVVFGVHAEGKTG
jgi:hypothetical protein